MKLIEWIKTCYSNQEIKKKEVNLEIPSNLNITINKEEENKNIKIQNIINNNIKEKNTSTSPNNKNVIVQKECSSNFSEMDFSPITNNPNNNDDNNTFIPPQVKSLNNQKKKKHSHFPKNSPDKSEFDKDKKIKKIRNHLMKDLF